MYGSIFSTDVEKDLKDIRRFQKELHSDHEEFLVRGRRSWIFWSLNCLGIFLITCFLGSKLSHSVNILVDSNADYGKADHLDFQAKNGQSTPPNIILILGDDMGLQDVGYNSNDLAGLTSNLDSLAAEGIVLTSYYTQQVCTPARAALLTGKYAIHTGMQHGSIGDREPWGLPLAHTLLPQYLKDRANYATHMVGKWHLGFYSPDYLPHKRGFDSQFGYLGGQESYFDHTMEVAGTEYYDWSLNGHPFMEAKGQYSTELITNQAVKIIEDHAAVISSAATEDDGAIQPLFLYLAYQAIHVPISEGIPDGYVHADSSVGRQILEIPIDARRKVAGMMYALDQNIALVVDALKDTGIYDNSIIIFASDNGGCARGGASNYPLRGNKNSLWEGGLRGPAFVHSPLLRKEVQGTQYTGLFHVTDWLPTILDGMLDQYSQQSSGSSLMELDGINLWDSLNGLSSASRHTILHNFEDYPDDDGANQRKAAIRLGDYKMIIGESSQGWYLPNEDNEDVVCESKYSQDVWYFNITEDPTEKFNLTDIPANIAGELWEELELHISTAITPGNRNPSKRSLAVWKKNDMCMVPWLKGEEKM